MAQHGALDLHHHRNHKFSKGSKLRKKVIPPLFLKQKCQQVSEASGWAIRFPDSRIKILSFLRGQFGRLSVISFRTIEQSAAPNAVDPGGGIKQMLFRCVFWDAARKEGPLDERAKKGKDGLN